MLGEPKVSRRTLLAFLTALAAAGSFVKVNAFVKVVRIDIVHFSNKFIALEQWFSQVFIGVDNVFSVSNHPSLTDFDRRVLFLNYVTGGDIGYAFAHDDLAKDLKNFFDIIINLFFFMILAELGLFLWTFFIWHFGS